jgi:hypothetical protein
VLLFLPILSGQISISTHLDFLFKCVRARCMFDCVCVCDCSCPSSPDRYPSACPWTSCSSVCVRVVCLCVRVCVCLFSPILSGHIPISMPLDFLLKCVRTRCLFVCVCVCVCVVLCVQWCCAFVRVITEQNGSDGVIAQPTLILLHAGLSICVNPSSSSFLHYAHQCRHICYVP